jgi:hypothetical protein
VNFLDKIFGKEDKQNLIDKSPCLAPWYFGKDNPKLIKDENVLRWKAIGSNGITSLTDESGNCYALLSMACYILPANDRKSFLIWDRSLEKTIGLQPIKIFYYECDKLQPIIERDKTISKMDREKSKIHFAVEPTAKVEFAFNPREEAMKFNFPDEFKKFEEFILLTELENLYHNPDPENYWHNTTMLIIKPEGGWVFNYPQDWFNKSNCDFGYQWITRAIRDPKTNLIHGQGIRLSDFVLDKSNRQQLDK